MIEKQDYEQRNKEKQWLNSKNNEKFYVNTREIWYCKLWINVWFEQNGKTEFRRPVLVLKKVWTMFLICPLTTKIKNTDRHHTLPEYATPKVSSLILSQIRVIDKKRFMDKVGEVKKQDFIRIQKIFQKLYFWED